MSEVTLRGIRKSFEGNPVIKGVDLDVGSGEFLVMVGPSGCGKTTLTVAASEDLHIVFDPGPTRRCWRHQNNFTRPGVSDPIGFTSLDDTSKCVEDNEGRPLWFVVTHAWSVARKGLYPGWDVGISGGNGTPIEVRLLNHASTPSPEEPDPCMVYEVSYDWSFPQNSFKLHPTGRSYRVADFTNLRHKFQAKLDHFASLPNPATGGPRCPSFDTAYATADFVVTFVGCDINAAGGGPRRETDILNLWLFNGTGFDGNGNPGDDIAFENCPTQDGRFCQRAYHAERLGRGIARLSRKYQDYDIDLASIYREKFPDPPGNCTLEHAQINHVEAYTSTRGHDLDISVRALNVLAAPYPSDRSGFAVD